MLRIASTFGIKICGGNNSKSVHYSHRKRVASFTHQTPFRKENQDGLLFLSNSHKILMAIADGVGGVPAGKEASQIVIQTLEENFIENYPIPMAIEWASLKILGLIQVNPQLLGMGTTLVAAEIKEREAQIYSCGDSRAFLIEKSGNIFLLTADQNDSFNKFQKEYFPISFPHLDPEEYYEYTRAFPEVNTLWNYLGKNNPTIFHLSLPLKKGDRLLLCSDGLCNALPYQYFANTVRQKRGIKQIVTGLFSQALDFMNKWGAGDNITIMMHEHFF